MLELSKHPLLKYLLFGNLYFSEGIQFALVSVIIIVAFTTKEIPISTATFVAGIAATPFTFKFIFGPITDYFIKHGRKIFIIIGAIIGGITLLPLFIINPKNALFPFTVLLFISHIGVVLVDVCADA